MNPNTMVSSSGTSNPHRVFLFNAWRSAVLPNAGSPQRGWPGWPGRCGPRAARVLYLRHGQSTGAGKFPAGRWQNAGRISAKIWIWILGHGQTFEIWERVGFWKWETSIYNVRSWQVNVQMSLVMFAWVSIVNTVEWTVLLLGRF